MKTRYLVLCAWSLALASARSAVVLTASATAPTVGAHDQASLNDLATIPGGDFNSQAFSDNAGPPGQSFTTGAEPAYLLTAFSYKGAAAGSTNYGGFTESTTWGIRISEVDGTTLTPVSTVTGIPHVVSSAGNDWFTWSFSGDDVVVLNSATTYAFEAYSSTGYLGFDASDVPDAYAGGTAFNTTSTARTFNSTTIQERNYDRTFVANLDAIPEPSGALLFAVALTGGLLRRRRAGCGL